MTLDADMLILEPCAVTDVVACLAGAGRIAGVLATASDADSLLCTVNAAVNSVRRVVCEAVADGDAAVKSADGAARAGLADSDAKAAAARLAIQVTDGRVLKSAPVAADPSRAP